MFILFIITIILANLIRCYDIYDTYAIYNDGYLEVNVNIENSDALENTSYFEYQNRRYYYQVEEISSINIIKNENYQTYKLSIKENFKQNKIIKITFFYNREKILDKILRIIF